MNAKEWLEKEGLYDSNNITYSDRLKPLKYFNLSNTLDKYASYKTRELEEKIQSFRDKLENLQKEIVYDYENIISEIVLKEFDKHFNKEEQ